MTEITNAIKNLPNISFIDDLGLDDLQGMLIGAFQEKYEQETGHKLTLSKADPNRIILLSCAQILYQEMQQINKAGRMNFLKYAYGEYLDNLSALKKVARNPARPASTQIKFTLAMPRETVTGIPAGTRVTADYEVYFSIPEYAEIPAGEMELTLLAVCTEEGTAGNGYAVGEINTLVDPIGFVDKVSNTEPSTGGTETEDDESMAERTFLAPSSYSTAGPDDAYTYWVKDVRPDIGDVKVTSPTPGIVDIRFIMDGGILPDDKTIMAVQEHVSQRGKRPLTDNVQVGRPEVERFTVDLKYYINASESSTAASIQENVSAAVNNYIKWQSSKIGRDINPDELTARVKEAGAKRVIIAAPEFRVVGGIAKAEIEGTPSVIYGGLEDD